MSEDLGNPQFLRYDFDDDTDSDVISGFFEKSVAEAISPGQEKEETETNFETDFQVFLLPFSLLLPIKRDCALVLIKR